MKTRNNQEIRIVLFLDLLFFLFIPDFLIHAPVAHAFTIPERLVYDLTWAGVKAGEATLEVGRDGEEIRIVSTVKSSDWVSVFYTVDNRVESRLSKAQRMPPIGQPLNFRLNLREGKRRRNREVLFDSPASKAICIDYLTKERREVEIPPFIFDPLSSFYSVRTMNLEVGKSVYVKVFDNKKTWDVEVKVLGKEKVEVPAGEFGTIVIKPLMKSEGIFARKGEIQIWLTDDEKRVPVKLRTKVRIGSVTAQLVGGNY